MRLDPDFPLVCRQASAAPSMRPLVGNEKRFVGINRIPTAQANKKADSNMLWGRSPKAQCTHVLCTRYFSVLQSVSLQMRIRQNANVGRLRNR